jgi:ornithine cyclodeaminase/alanine dehydrogenase-like protein (mu-crystallin family)
MLVLSNRDILTLLNLPTIIGAVREAALAIQDSETVLPERQHLDWPGATLLIMPARVNQSVGVKLVSVVPGNAESGLPVTNGTMLLNDGNTGFPLCLVSADQLTAVRTGAISALSIKYMTPDMISSLGIIGCGTQGAWQAICACAVRPIREIYYWARSSQRELQFIQTVSRHASAVRLTPCASAFELLSKTSLVIAATTSHVPVFPDEPALLRGKHFISIGSFKPSMQELPMSVYRLAGHLVIDSDAAREEVGDVRNPMAAGILRSEDIYHLSDLVDGRHEIDVKKTTVFKGVGLAIYDLFVAQALYLEALRANIGQKVEL